MAFFVLPFLITLRERRGDRVLLTQRMILRLKNFLFNTEKEGKYFRRGCFPARADFSSTPRVSRKTEFRVISLLLLFPSSFRRQLREEKKNLSECRFEGLSREKERKSENLIKVDESIGSLKASKRPDKWKSKSKSAPSYVGAFN